MKCPFANCGIELHTPAEAFLHKRLHEEPYDPGAHNLGNLPYVLMPRIAAIMEDYCDFLSKALRATLPWLSSYPGGGALGCYDLARAALVLDETEAKQSPYAVD